MEAQAQRKKFVGGNWKSNWTCQQVKDFVNGTLSNIVFDCNTVDVIIAPVFLHLSCLKDNLKNGIQIAAQNASSTSFGAFTGEVTAEQIKDLGLEWVIIGHSERRQYFGETDDIVAGKVKMCLDKGLKVIACIGEKLADREAGKTKDVCYAQLAAIGAKLSKDDWKNVVVAYEPVWAIGTGKSATAEQAQETHLEIRTWLKSVDESIAQQTRILYGGSVTGANSVGLIAKPDIDGFLVGGASMKPEFKDIVASCSGIYRKKFVGGNWKSNMTVEKINSFVKDTLNPISFCPCRVDVVVAPVYAHLPLAKNLLTNGIQVAAQNASATSFGAFTGEITAEHIKDIGLNWVIIGHSERRSLFGETNDVVGGKVKTCLDKGLNVIACIGEKLEDREGGKTKDVCFAQLDAIKAKLTPEDWSRVVVAYEPVWAIGTGKSATAEQAQETHEWIRTYLKGISEKIAAATRILYGGSVTGANCASLIAKPDIDGFLVGGAALKPEFQQIIDCCWKGDCKK